MSEQTTIRLRPDQCFAVPSTSTVAPVTVSCWCVACRLGRLEELVAERDEIVGGIFRDVFAVLSAAGGTN